MYYAILTLIQIYDTKPERKPLCDIIHLFTFPKVLESDLQVLSKYPEFVGCRVINVTQDDWLSQDHVIRAMKVLTHHNKTFDILVK